MSNAANEALIREHFAQVWNGARPEAVWETLAADFTGRDPNAREPTHGPEGYMRATQAFRTAFPDAQFSIEELVSDGDRVVARLLVRATHSADWHGMPPTGKPVAVDGVIIYRIAAGKIAESWGLFDILGLMQQLGKSLV